VSEEDEQSTESSAASSDQAVGESVAMLTNFFDLKQKSSTLLSSGDDEPLPSMFGRKQDGDGANSSKGRSSKFLLVVIGSFLILATGGLLLSFLVFSSDKSAIEPAGALEASSSPAGSDAVEAPQTPPVAPTQQLDAEGEPWSDAMETYKKLLAKQDASNASTPKHTTNDPVLGQYEGWLKAKPQ
jgi:hypothetical protein